MRTINVINELKTHPAGLIKLVSTYANGDLSFGQFARALGKSYSDAAKLLTLLNVPVLDYDLADELDTLAQIKPAAGQTCNPNTKRA